MELQFYQTKIKVMSTDLLKERLHLRIEQADEKLLSVLDQFAETLFVAYHNDSNEEKERLARIAAYKANLKPMTKEELIARALASQEDIEAGRIHDLEEVKASLGL